MMTTHPGATVVHLLDGFEVELCGRTIPFSLSAQFVVGYLALRGASDRRSVAAALWPEADKGQAGARLRTAVWRVQRVAPGLLTTTGSTVQLADDVDVDVNQLLRASYQPEAQLPPRAQLWGGLLPGWYEDWVSTARERFRDDRLVAMDALAERLLRGGQYAGAVEVAMACIAAEPLRENAHRMVVRVHLAEGNSSEAIRHIESYRDLLREEIDDEPSPEMSFLLAHALKMRTIPVSALI